MGGKIGRDDEDVIAEINITPMVDIMLVLLIIFMVTTSVINQPAIEVELPEAATGGPTETTSLGIFIDKASTWYLNGTPTTQDGLRAAIRTAKLEPDVDLMALIAADRSVPHGEVVTAIDLVKQEGVLKFAINIDPVALPPQAAGATAPAEQPE